MGFSVFNLPAHMTVEIDVPVVAKLCVILLVLQCQICTDIPLAIDIRVDVLPVIQDLLN